MTEEEYRQRRKEIDKKSYEKHKAKRLAYCRAYKHSHRKQRAKKQKEWAARNIEKCREMRIRWRKNNPGADKAHRILNYAIERGKVIRGLCRHRRFGNCFGRIEAHHKTYSEPLKVMWLCQVHHAALHYRRR